MKVTCFSEIGTSDTDNYLAADSTGNLGDNTFTYTQNGATV